MKYVEENIGINFKKDNFTVIKKVGKKGDIIDRHNHPEANVIFTIVKGKIEGKINEDKFSVEPGKILHFDGDNYISAEFIEDSEVFITLVLK